MSKKQFPSLTINRPDNPLHAVGLIIQAGMAAGVNIPTGESDKILVDLQRNGMDNIDKYVNVEEKGKKKQ